VGNTPTLSLMNGIIIYGQGQTAPDGKIYLSRYNAEDSLDSQTLSVINCPNKYGTAAGFVENGFTLLPNTFVSFSLPNNIEYFLQSEDSCGTINIRADYTYLKQCYLDSIPFIDMSFNNITSWQWNFGDPGSGAANTSSLKNPKHKFSTFGNYNVTLIVSDGVFSDAIIYPAEIINCFPESVNEYYPSFETKVVPNPANDQCTFTFFETGEKYFMEIYDLTGRLVFEEKNITGNSITISTSALSSGTYFFRVNSGKKYSHGKLMISH